MVVRRAVLGWLVLLTLVLTAATLLPRWIAPASASGLERAFAGTATTEAASVYNGWTQRARAHTRSGVTVLVTSSVLGSPPVMRVPTQAGVAAEGDFGMLARARMARTLNPEAGSIGGGGFTGSAAAHGAERMAEAGFDDIDVALMRGGTRYEQSDGAFAYVAQAGRNSYNMFVENTNGAIVTAHRGMSFDDLSGLARNFGWSGW